jgi:ATP-dependent Clp protease ATP-binding subunit ClpB
VADGKTGDYPAARFEKRIESMRNEMEAPRRAYDLNRLAELKYGRLPELENG